MKKYLSIVLLPLLTLTGCAWGVHDVKPVKDDIYTVTYAAGFKPLSWVEIKNVTLERADAHCQSMGMKMVQPQITSNKATGLIPKEATTRFRCVAPGTDVTS